MFDGRYALTKTRFARMRFYARSCGRGFKAQSEILVFSARTRATTEINSFFKKVLDHAKHKTPQMRRSAFINFYNLKYESSMISCEPIKAVSPTRADTAPKRRAAFAEQNAHRNFASLPCCKRCGQPATVVDHVVTIRKAPQRRLDRTNLQSLCQRCHSGWKQRQERT